MPLVIRVVAASHTPDGSPELAALMTAHLARMRAFVVVQGDARNVEGHRSRGRGGLEQHM